MQCFQHAYPGGTVEISDRGGSMKEIMIKIASKWWDFDLRNGHSSPQNEWWSERSLHCKPPPNTNGNLSGTVQATWLHREINPCCQSLSLLHSDTAVAADKHYLVCDHVHSVTPRLPPLFSFKISQSGADCVDTVGCHTVSTAGVSIASVAVTSQKTLGSISLLTSSVCLAACLIAGVCSGEEKRQLSRCTRHRQA